MDPKDAVKVMGTIAMAMAIAPMLGPIVGGLFDEIFGWRATFWFYLTLGSFLFLLTWLDLGETNKNHAKGIPAIKNRVSGILAMDNSI